MLEYKCSLILGEEILSLFEGTLVGLSQTELLGIRGRCLNFFKYWLVYTTCESYAEVIRFLSPRVLVERLLLIHLSPIVLRFVMGYCACKFNQVSRNAAIAVVDPSRLCYEIRTRHFVSISTDRWNFLVRTLQQEVAQLAVVLLILLPVLLLS
jgi:hypothetical protein